MLANSACVSTLSAVPCTRSASRTSCPPEPGTCAGTWPNPNPPPPRPAGSRWGSTQDAPLCIPPSTSTNRSKPAAATPNRMSSSMPCSLPTEDSRDSHTTGNPMDSHCRNARTPSVSSWASNADCSASPAASRERGGGTPSARGGELANSAASTARADKIAVAEGEHTMERRASARDTENAATTAEYDCTSKMSDRNFRLSLASSRSRAAALAASSRTDESAGLADSPSMASMPAPIPPDLNPVLCAAGAPTLVMRCSTDMSGAAACVARPVWCTLACGSSMGSAAVPLDVKAREAASDSVCTCRLVGRCRETTSFFAVEDLNVVGGETPSTPNPNTEEQVSSSSSTYACSRSMRLVSHVTPSCISSSRSRCPTNRPYREVSREPAEGAAAFVDATALLVRDEPPRFTLANACRYACKERFANSSCTLRREEIICTNNRGTSAV